MTVEISFWVTGEPAPQGSKRHVGGGRMIESSTKVKPWREDVQNAALVARMHTPEWDAVPDKAVELEATFWLRRPPSISEKKRPLPSVKPDLDKLLRSTMDALTTSGTLADDARVVGTRVYKKYAQPGAATGANIRLVEVTE